MSAAMLCAVCVLVGACDTCSAMGVYPVKSTRRATVSRAAKTLDYRREHSNWRTARNGYRKCIERTHNRKIRYMDINPIVEHVPVHVFPYYPTMISVGDVAAVRITKEYIFNW
jgi:hypothetical protein